jgi:hypothetical protein
VDWLEAECRRLGVTVVTGAEVGPDDLGGRDVVLATGSRPRDAEGAVDALTALRAPLPDGPVVVQDPVGGHAGVALAEHLAAQGREVALVSQDPVAGTLLSITGDLADANTRLQRLGVRRELKALLRGVADGQAQLEDVWTGTRRRVPCAVLVDAGHRLPEESLYTTGTPRAGDCVAPRTVLEAVLEGRRRALELTGAAAVAHG